MTATIHDLHPASTYPSPSAITAAARHLTAANLPPSVASRVCPDPLAASALETAMEQLALVESVSCALIREASRQ
jgi:hypothetical protein